MYIPQWYTWPGLPGYQMSQLGQKNYTFTRYNQLSSKYLKSPKKQNSQLTGHLNRHLAGGTLQVLWGGWEYQIGQLGQKNYIFTRYSTQQALKFLKSPKKQKSQLLGYLNGHPPGVPCRYPGAPRGYLGMLIMGQVDRKKIFIFKYSLNYASILI